MAKLLAVRRRSSPLSCLPALRAISDAPHLHAARLATRWHDDLDAAPLAPVPPVRGERVPPCDFPLAERRETAGWGMLDL